jgi:hypothetical protein
LGFSDDLSPRYLERSERRTGRRPLLCRDTKDKSRSWPSFISRLYHRHRSAPALT